MYMLKHILDMHLLKHILHMYMLKHILDMYMLKHILDMHMQINELWKFSSYPVLYTQVTNYRT